MERQLKRPVPKITVHCQFTEMVATVDLKPHEDNPNRHPDAQIEKIAHVLRVHGWRLPITVSSRSGKVIRGHGRLMAAKFLGLEHVPVDLQDYPDEEAELADLVADNEVARGAETDEEALRAILGNIDNPLDFGMDSAELADLMGKIDAAGTPEPTPEPPATEKRKSAATSGITYTLVFDDEDQQARWFAFLRDLKRKHGETATVAGRLDLFLRGLDE